MSKVEIDMTGWKMWEHGVPGSKLTVIGRVEDGVDPQGKPLTRWLCECNCEEHNQIVVSDFKLRLGRTLSCGCIIKERRIVNKGHHKYNRYDLSGEYGVGWTSNTNKDFYFDLEDYDLIKNYTWFEDVTGHNFHYLRAYNPETKRLISMHVLLGCKYYDHIDRNVFNNRKNNLRPCTQTQNAMNRTIARNNKSGIIGVRCTKHNTWAANLSFKGENKLNKIFKNKDDAIRARLQAEAEYFGEFAPQRHLFEEYGIETIQND